MTHPSDPSPPGETSVSATELRAIARNLGPVDRGLVEAAADQLDASRREIDDLRLQKTGLEALLVDAQEEIARLKAALRPFAAVYRTMKATDQAMGARHCDVKHFARAAELVPENT
jgi:hypothetical protein